MLKKVFWIILLLALIFLGRKETIAFFCETELNKEQVLYEQSADTLTIPPDSVMQEKVILSITAHIVRKENGGGGISETVVLEEIERLNRAFAPIGISFEVCTFNYINDKRFYNLTKYDEARLITYDIENTINIYFVNQIHSVSEGKICGYTYYPTKKLDNLFMANSCVPNGTTLIHEFGHFFGLYHTHEVKFGTELVSGANCDVAGDLICDTAADPGLRSSLISSSCEFTGFVTDVFNTAYAPPVHNYMSYSRQSCRNRFSARQLFKMRVNYQYFKTHIKKLNTSFKVSDSVIVKGDTLTLVASGGTSYWWSTGDTTAQISTTPDTSGIYSVNIVTANACNIFKKYAVAVISGDFISAPEYICEGEAAEIVLNNTKAELVYIISEVHGDAVYSSLGNGGTLQISTHVPTTPPDQNVEYKVSILDPLTERSWQLKKTISIRRVPMIDEKEIEVVLPSDSICQGSVASIKIPSTDPGLHYQLWTGGKGIGEAKKGNGNTLTLLTPPVDTAATYHLLVFNECDRKIKKDMISFIPFPPTSSDAVAFSLSSRDVVKGEIVRVKIGNSQPGLSYQLMLNNATAGEAVPGNGEVLVLQTPPVHAKTEFCLIVYNDQTGCRTTTSYPIVIEVKAPGPPFGYKLTSDLLTYSFAEQKYSRLKLYHLSGREALRLTDQLQSPGEYRYRLDPVALNISPGRYMLRWEVEGKLILQQIIQVSR